MSLASTHFFLLLTFGSPTSVGSITLQSSNPFDQPIVDPKSVSVL